MLSLMLSVNKKISVHFGVSHCSCICYVVFDNWCQIFYRPDYQTHEGNRIAASVNTEEIVRHTELAVTAESELLAVAMLKSLV